MSKFAINMKCDICKEREIGLVELSVGETKHHLCYKCMYKFVKDLDVFVDMNYDAEDIASYL